MATLRLTNTLRDAFIRSVMNDVPKQEVKQQALYKMAHAYAMSKVPANIKKLFLNPETKQYILTRYMNISLFGEDKNRVANIYTNDEDFQLPGKEALNLRHQLLKDDPKFIELLNATREYQEAEIKFVNLRRDLGSAAYSCTTLKALKEALPEFIKYMPNEPDEPVQKGYALVLNRADIVSTFKDLGGPANQALKKAA